MKNQMTCLVATTLLVMGVTSDGNANTNSPIDHQLPPITKEVILYRANSEFVQNRSNKTSTIYTHLVVVEDATSLQIQFGKTIIPEGVVLRTTSLFDGAVQHHRSNTLQQWKNKSAWFNGSMVLVELIAEPTTPNASVSIESITTIYFTNSERTICGNTDDRVLSDVARCARAMPIGCSSWVIDDANHQFLTAGHCAPNGYSDIQTVEFNVPLSSESGAYQHPGPEDQYATDSTSFQQGHSGIGDDWAYFGCFPNTETGLSHFQAQGGAYYVLSNSPPNVTNQQITIVGYGSVSPPVSLTWNGVQKTHTGPYVYFEGSAIGYATDTSGGNSGSPVLNESTGEAIGIHTNGGCGGGGGNNWGCGINNSGLQYALANPLGVCVPNITGACCIGTSICIDIPESNCNAGGGTWLGPNTVCADGECKSPSCEADIDGNGSVDVGDLLAVIDAWGQVDSPADINSDGVVNVSDLLIVIRNWGECE
jgi:V8-like Glu-specific endopeptidase